MHDAQDAEDTRLLEAGEHQILLASYYEMIIQRCTVRCRSTDDALECAQTVAVRLLSELERQKRYHVPFRVVVHKVIEWTTKGFYARPGPIFSEFLDELFAALNPYDEFETRYDLERAIETLPDGDRDAARLRFLHGQEIASISDRLGKNRNALDQSLRRSRLRLQELLG